MADVLKISDLSREFDLTLRTLRFWEQKKLLSPARRGTRRLYSEADRERVRRIALWSAAGFSLKEIASLLKLLAEGRNSQLHVAVRDGLATVSARAAAAEARRIQAADTLRSELRQEAA